MGNTDRYLISNIICNSCVGAQTYVLRSIPFDNPFMWNIIVPRHFLYLISNYSKIDFENIQLFKEYQPKIQKNKPLYRLNIDNGINLYFIHHHFDETAKKPVKDRIDLYYNNIENYIIETYKRRLQRMHDNPVFIVDANKFWKRSDIFKFLDLDTPYSKYLITCDQTIKTDACSITYLTYRKSTRQIANEFLNNLSIEFSNT